MKNEKWKMKNWKVGRFEFWAGLGRGRKQEVKVGIMLTVWAGRGSFGL